MTGKGWNFCKALVWLGGDGTPLVCRCGACVTRLTGYNTASLWLDAVTSSSFSFLFLVLLLLLLFAVKL